MVPVMTYPRVPRLWPGSIVVCLACGPSLTQADVDYCRDRGRVIAIKDAIQLAPWADCWYAADAKYWKHVGTEAMRFEGLRFALECGAAQWATVLLNTGFTGLELEPNGLRTGKNSGYQAINLAVHFGATRIVLLGFDQAPNAKGHHHFYRSRTYSTTTPPYSSFVPLFDTIVAPLQKLGITCLNASRATALTCFKKTALVDALS